MEIVICCDSAECSGQWHPDSPLMPSDGTHTYITRNTQWGYHRQAIRSHRSVRWGKMSHKIPDRVTFPHWALDLQNMLYSFRHIHSGYAHWAAQYSPPFLLPDRGVLISCWDRGRVEGAPRVDSEKQKKWAYLDRNGVGVLAFPAGSFQLYRFGLTPIHFTSRRARSLLFLNSFKPCQ